MSEYKLKKYLAKLESTTNHLKRELYRQKVKYYQKGNTMRGGNLPTLRTTLQNNISSILGGITELGNITRQTMSMSKNYNNIIRATMFGNEILRDIQGKLNGPVTQSIHNKDLQIKRSQPDYQRGGDGEPDHMGDLRTDIKKLYGQLVSNQKDIDNTKQQIDKLIDEIIILIDALESCRQKLKECGPTQPGEQHKEPHGSPPPLGPDATIPATIPPKPQASQELGDTLRVPEKQGQEGQEGEVADNDKKNECGKEQIRTLVHKIIALARVRGELTQKYNNLHDKYNNYVNAAKNYLKQINEITEVSQQRSALINTNIIRITEILQSLKGQDGKYNIPDCNETGKEIDEWTGKKTEAISTLENLKNIQDWPRDAATFDYNVDEESTAYFAPELTAIKQAIQKEYGSIPHVNKILGEYKEFIKDDLDAARTYADPKLD